MVQAGRIARSRPNLYNLIMSIHHDIQKCYYKKKKNTAQKLVIFDVYCFIIISFLSLQIANTNYTSMKTKRNASKDFKFDTGHQVNDAPRDDLDGGDVNTNENIEYSNVNFAHNPFYNSEDFLHLNNQFYNGESGYSHYEDYKKFYLSPSNTVPKSKVRFKISSRILQTRCGKLQGIVLAMDEHRYLSPLEVFLGVPYATPPVGSNRFSPTRTPSPWDGVRVSDRAGPSCPQQLPAVDDPVLLDTMPKGRLAYLKRLIPYLKNQSEDCLYLNVFAPLQMDESKVALPVVVFVHGDSYAWGAGTPYDGALLASYADVVVVTLNYRLGILGFLNANPAPHAKARVANYGLMDQIAALHWVQQNIALFGGDPSNVTLMGHGTGAACINFLMMSPTVMPGLFHRSILLSGSALSSWAIVDDPVHYALKLAKHMNCAIPDDMAKDHEIIVDCLREASIQDLLSFDITPPNFLTAFGPSVDGVVIKTDFAKDFLTMYSNDFPSFGPLNNMNVNMNLHVKRDSGRRLFQGKYDLLFSVVSNEALWKFSANDVQNGIEPEKRDRILRTYVRNAYTYHLSEIFYTIVNEYTDWERTVENPRYTIDACVAALSDAQYVAPLVASAELLGAAPAAAGDDPAGRNVNTHFCVFDYQSKDGYYPQQSGAVHGEELQYIFGAPLAGGFGHFPANYSKAEVALAESMMLMVANFAKTGNPNDNARQESLLPASRERNKLRGLHWDPYDTTHQKYLEIGMKPRIKNHFRAHQLSVWLRLVPELHRAGMQDVAARHNLFKNHDDLDLYEGSVRRDSRTKLNENNLNNGSSYADTGLTTVDTILETCVTVTPTNNGVNSTDGALASLEAAGYAAYSTALSVTIAIGCSLLILNVLIFAGVYYQRDKSRNRHNNRRLTEKHFETISGKHSHYHMDPKLAPSLVVDVERQDRKRQSSDRLASLNFRGPLESKLPPSPPNGETFPSEFGSRASSFRLPHGNYPPLGFASLPRGGSSPRHRMESSNDPARAPHATLRRNKPLHSNLPQAAIDEMRV